MVHVSVSEANQHKLKIKKSHKNDELLIYSCFLFFVFGFFSGFTEEKKFHLCTFSYINCILMCFDI